MQEKGNSNPVGLPRIRLTRTNARKASTGGLNISAYEVSRNERCNPDFLQLWISRTTFRPFIFRDYLLSFEETMYRDSSPKQSKKTKQI